jgi:peptidoglycan/xylan/chitin deacetylase (PgdA/CDA1 family)
MSMATTFTRPALRAHGKSFWAGVLRASGLLYLAKKWVQSQGAIVLTFHRVFTESEMQQTASLAGMIVRRESFAGFLKYAAEACQFVDLSVAPDWRPSGKLKLAITFDDGWSDNATTAYPLACRYRAPMLIFIAPTKMGAQLPFWPERTAAALDHGPSPSGTAPNSDYIEQAIQELKGLPAAERERRVAQMTATGALYSSASVDTTMTWEEVAELRAGGVSFGSHTSTHEILTVIPLAQAEQEITSSRRLIEEKLNAPCALFSYPNGDCSEQVRRLVASSGYRLAFLNQDPGVWTQECDPYLIPRVNVCEYHLVDAKGSFSPLIFDYAVVWSAAKGLLAERRSAWRRKLHGRWQSWLTRLSRPGGKKQLEKPS